MCFFFLCFFWLFPFLQTFILPLPPSDRLFSFLRKLITDRRNNGPKKFRPAHSPRSRPEVTIGKLKKISHSFGFTQTATIVNVNQFLKYTYTLTLDEAFLNYIQRDNGKDNSILSRGRKKESHSIRLKRRKGQSSVTCESYVYIFFEG